MVEMVSVLGSTGSIGTQTLDVARRLGIRVDALAAGSNEQLLEEQCREFHPKTVYIEEGHFSSLRTRLRDTSVRVVTGREALCALAAESDAPTVVNALTGILGLLPTLHAIDAGKDIALANKETLVAGGDIVMRLAAERGVRILPVDSEHSAIFQCLQAAAQPPEKLLLTGSGGPFFGKDSAFLQMVRPEDALKHPNWSMGKKITVDSSTLMNKGLELIEAVHLFGVRPEQIEVVIHRESVIHSMVQFADRAVLAQMGSPDMRLCIQYALTYPDRMPCAVKELDLFALGKLTFARPDEQTFPLLALAKACIARGGNLPAALNGANEAAVWQFLRGEIGYTDIFRRVENAVAATTFVEHPTIEEILQTDLQARAL